MATYDPTTGGWGSLPGLPEIDDVKCLAVVGGTLYAAGNFGPSGGPMDSGLARWNGSGWSTIAGAPNYIAEMVALPSGALLVGGAFNVAAGGPFNYLASWSGASWSPFGPPIVSPVTAMALGPTGALFVASQFPNTAGAHLGAARLAGNTWVTLGDEIYGDVHAFRWQSNGDMIIGGSFASIGSTPARLVARWNGTAWSAVGTTLQAGGSVSSVEVLPNNQILAAGEFFGGGNHVSRWNGVTWSSVGVPAIASQDENHFFVRASTTAVLPSGEIVVGGQFSSVGGVGVRSIAKWNGTIWSKMGMGLNCTDAGIAALSVRPNGDIFAGGQFNSAGAVNSDSIAYWSGGVWHALDSGVNGSVYALTSGPNGAVVVGGDFTRVGGAPVSHAGGTPMASVAAWNGSVWSELGDGLQGPVYALATLPNGNVVAGGSFTNSGPTPLQNIAFWNGASWNSLGGGLPGEVRAVLAVGNTLFAAGGESVTPTGSGYLAQLIGNSWTTIGSFHGGDPWVRALADMTDGSLVVGGGFTSVDGLPVSRIARWNGATWFTMDGGMNERVVALHSLPGGGVVAGGSFTTAGLHTVNGLARWVPSSGWRGVNNGADGEVKAIALADRDLLCGGTFLNLNDRPSPFIGGCSCPATWEDFGTGCLGPNTIDTLQATGLPVLGSAFSTEASGLPVPALWVSTTSLTPVSPPVLLGLYFPEALPFCYLRAGVDNLVAGVSTGSAVTTLQLGSNPSFAGLNFYQQIVLWHDQGSQGWVMSATNALRMTAGTF